MSSSKESNSAKRSTREKRKVKSAAANAKTKLANYLREDDTVPTGELLKRAASRVIGRK